MTAIYNAQTRGTVVSAVEDGYYLHLENRQTGERFTWASRRVRCLTFAYGATHVETTDGKVQTFANPGNWLATGDQGFSRCSLL